MARHVRRRQWISAIAAAAACLPITLASGARAQSPSCDRLYAAIQAADGAGHGSSRWARAAQQQSSEIARTQRYADQLGCENGGLFGSDPPPQCNAIVDRLQHMRDNLAAIQSRAEPGSGSQDGQREALVARYNASCIGVGGGNPADLAQQSFRGTTLDDGQSPYAGFDPDRLSTVPLDGNIMDDPGDGGRSHGQAICVRTCDGGYFPLSSHARDDQLDGLEQLCEASCPNTEAKLYTMGSAGELSSATAVDGTSYTALPDAFKFEKTFTPACTCKPPNQSWTDALANAEKLLDVGRHDITVTAAISDQMALPGAVPPAKGKSAKLSKSSKPSAADLGADAIARDGQKGQQAPTLSNDTTGIGGPVQAARVVREGDGPTVAIAGPDGVTKRVRLIVP